MGANVPFDYQTIIIICTSLHNLYAKYQKETPFLTDAAVHTMNAYHARNHLLVFFSLSLLIYNKQIACNLSVTVATLGEVYHF